jgi:uncharacterized delta-60 repeat protein
MIKVNSNSLNLKGGKTLVGDIEYGSNISQILLNPSSVSNILTQSDGKIILTGPFFTSYSGSTVNKIVRINPDRTVDPDFNTGAGFNGSINTITQQSDNKIVAGGFFTSYSGSAANRVVRINLDGTIDPDFHISGGFNGTVSTIIQQSDGKLVIGGSFTSYSGSTANRIVRINPSGSIDTTFNTGTGFSSGVNTIIQQSDGKLVVGGFFSQYSGSTNQDIVRINPDGTKDTTFNVGTGILGDAPYIIIQQSDGKIVAGGSFNTYSGSANSCIVRINPDGTKDTTFNIGTGIIQLSENYEEVTDIVQQPDDKLVVGGYFAEYSGSANRGIVRINPDGTKDTTFNIGTGLGGDFDSVNSINIQPDNNLIIGGFFSSFSGSIEGKYDGIISLNTSGSVNENFNFGGGVRSAGNIRTICKLNNSDILVGGRISRLSIPPLTQSFGGLVLLDNNLNIKQTYPFSPPDESINIIIQQSDGKIVVGGQFTSYSGSANNRIVRINPDGTKDFTFAISGGFSNSPITIIQQSDGKLVVGGFFSQYSGSAVNEIVRINLDGTIDTTFNTGTGLTGTSVNSIIQQSDGKIVVGGEFTFYSGSTVNRILRINPSGSIDTTFAISGGFNGTVNSILQQPDGKIVAGGQFTLYSGSTANRIVRINPSGSIDTTFAISGGFDNFVFSIIQQSDNRLVAGGDFISYSGSAANRIVRINPGGSIDTIFSTGTGFNSTVRSIIQQSDNNLLVGGSYNTYSGSGDFNIVSINNDGTITKERIN